MAEKKTYWMQDHAGNKALITGAEERDRWIPHGWTDTDEPGDRDFVWLRHPDLGEPTNPIVWAARDYWQGRDWVPGAPPEPVNPALDPALTAPREKPAKAEKATTSKPATGSEKNTKE